MSGKWWTVTAYYSLTSLSIGLLAESEELAEEMALAAMEEEWGKEVYKYEDIDVREQE